MPSEGAVFYDEREITAVNTNVGYVTQRDNLLPWRTLEGNMRLGLELRGMRKSQTKAPVAEMMSKVGLEGYGKHYPHQLSGGMRKRAALARTLICPYEAILMDEPFSALDAQLKLLLQQELLRLWEEMELTIVYVTHDIREAIALSDRIVVLSGQPGHVIGTFPSTFSRPRDILELEGEPRFQQLRRELWDLLRPDIELER